MLKIRRILAKRESCITAKIETIKGVQLGRERWKNQRTLERFRSPKTIQFKIFTGYSRAVVDPKIVCNPGTAGVGGADGKGLSRKGHLQRCIEAGICSAACLSL